MKFGLIGGNDFAASIANAMMLLSDDIVIHMSENKATEYSRARKGNYYEMVMVSKITGNRVVFTKLPAVHVDAYVIAVGDHAAKDPTKIFTQNMNAVMEVLPKTEDKPLFVATQPSKLICDGLKKFGYDARETMTCIDRVKRIAFNDDWRRINNMVIDNKGDSTFGPAAAVAFEVLGQMKCKTKMKSKIKKTGKKLPSISSSLE